MKAWSNCVSKCNIKFFYFFQCPLFDSAILMNVVTKRKSLLGFGGAVPAAEGKHSETAARAI